MNENQRIELSDTPMSMCMKLADGNPGAITALMKMMGDAEKIDPDSAWGPLGPLISLDTLGIYGSRIWMLWKDVCGQDSTKAETLFRANQLDIIRDADIFNAIEGQHKPDFDALLAKVKEQLPKFALAA